jgi:hypothetical protein
MIRNATQSQGGYTTLPVGIVVRHSIAKEDQTKCDPASILVVVVAHPYATTYTIAHAGGYLEVSNPHVIHSPHLMITLILT